MAITTKPMPGSEMIHVDLSGPDGNAFSLIALGQKLAKQLHYQPEERAELTTEMMGGDYDNLLGVFDKHFGAFVTLHK